MKVSENDLIEYAKVYFKECGFKKVAKRWTILRVLANKAEST